MYHQRIPPHYCHVSPDPDSPRTKCKQTCSTLHDIIPPSIMSPFLSSIPRRSFQSTSPWKAELGGQSFPWSRERIAWSAGLFTNKGCTAVNLLWKERSWSPRAAWSRSELPPPPPCLSALCQGGGDLPHIPVASMRHTHSRKGAGIGIIKEMLRILWSSQTAGSSSRAWSISLTAIATLTSQFYLYRF